MRWFVTERALWILNVHNGTKGVTWQFSRVQDALKGQFPGKLGYLLEHS